MARRPQAAGVSYRAISRRAQPHGSWTGYASPARSPCKCVRLCHNLVHRVRHRAHREDHLLRRSSARVHGIGCTAAEPGSSLSVRAVRADANRLAWLVEHCFAQPNIGSGPDAEHFTKPRNDDSHWLFRWRQCELYPGRLEDRWSLVRERVWIGNRQRGALADHAA